MTSMSSALSYSSPPERQIAGKTIMQIIPDLQSGGAERTTVDIAQALTQVGARCLVASRGGRMVSELQGKGGVWMPFPAATKNPLAMALNSVRLARLLRDEGVDIVHARSRAPAWVAYYAARQAGTLFVTTYHSAYSGTSPVKRRYNAVMAAGDMVIANSEFTARRIVELHPEAAGRIAVIPRGIDLVDFAPHVVPPQDVQKLRAAWKVEPHRRIVLLPGRLTERKGQLVLIDAAQLLVSQGFDDVRFVMAGDCRSEAFKRELEARIRRLGLTERVILPGYCADMPAAYLAAAVVVVPSTAPEAFGRVAVEAQAMGAPVVVSDLGAASEIVRAPPQTHALQATGWRTPPGDAQALASAIAQALSLTATARQSLALRARDFVQSRYSLEGMCEATLAVYERLLGDR
jgi:glycosyltransferase involved in cell wall biosynthesis